MRRVVDTVVLKGVRGGALPGRSPLWSKYKTNRFSRHYESELYTTAEFSRSSRLLANTLGFWKKFIKILKMCLDEIKKTGRLAIGILKNDVNNLY